jgi:hypothetical protein
MHTTVCCIKAERQQAPLVQLGHVLQAFLVQLWHLKVSLITMTYVYQLDRGSMGLLIICYVCDHEGEHCSWQEVWVAGQEVALGTWGCRSRVLCLFLVGLLGGRCTGPLCLGGGQFMIMKWSRVWCWSVVLCRWIVIRCNVRFGKQGARGERWVCRMLAGSEQPSLLRNLMEGQDCCGQCIRCLERRHSLVDQALTVSRSRKHSASALSSGQAVLANLARAVSLLVIPSYF